jgi:hypothetical protein
LAVQFTSIKEAGFNRKATRSQGCAVAFLFDGRINSFMACPVVFIQVDVSHSLIFANS